MKPLTPNSEPDRSQTCGPHPTMCALQVMRFWDKAGRVLGYKQRTLVAARKKVVMDKHLDFLVGQTQRYSTLLAERLKAAEESGGQEGTGGEPIPLALPEVK